MPMLDRVTMIEPSTGRSCSVLVIDREAFEKQGYELLASDLADNGLIPEPRRAARQTAPRKAQRRN